MRGIPFVSDIIVNEVPIDVDKQVGQKILREIPNSEIDEEKSILLKDFFNQLVIGNETQIIVVKGPIFNAFALPGNSIVVFEEVIKSVHSYPELSALLAHEYAHIKNRHGMRTLAHENLQALLTNELGGDGVNNSDNFIRNANMLRSAKKSRGFEKQADLDGLDILRKNKINSQGFIDLLETINSLEESEKKNKQVLSVYFSTHPETKDRIAYIKDEISENTYTFENNFKLEEVFKQLQK